MNDRKTMLREYSRRYAERNPEKLRESKRAYYLANREACIKRSAENRRSQKEALPVAQLLTMKWGA